MAQDDTLFCVLRNKAQIWYHNTGADMSLDPKGKTMKASKIIVRRYPYEEPEDLHIMFLVSNSNFSSKVDIYCCPDDLEKIGKSLRVFPTKVPDEYVYEYGSEDPGKKFYRFFKMRIYTIQLSGQCAIQFAINLNENEPNEGISRFSISPIEPMSLSRLGDLFISFSKLQHLEFCWSPSGDQELFDSYQN